jgi:hypothetical protein
MNNQDTRYNNQIITNNQIPITKPFGHWLLKFGICLVIVSWLLVICQPVLAQGQAGTDIAVLKAGVGARPLGMGGAFTAVADNADAPYWNPAGLGWVKDSEITTMQTKLSTDADHYYISYVQPALGGTLGVSWIQVGLGSITQTSSEVDKYNEVQNLSIFSYFSNAYMFSYGRNLNEHVSIGLTGKYLTSDMFGISQGQAWGYSVTPGILIRLRSPVRVTKPVSLLGNEVRNEQRASGIDTGIGPVTEPTGITIGLKVDELFNQQQWGTGTIEQVPPKLRLGLAYKSPNPGLLALDISQTMRSNYAPEISLGYEWSLINGLTFRAGYTEGGITAGAGFAVNNARVDYAYVTQKALSKDNVHRVSLSGIW